jgi:hypothetical protein
MAWCLISAQGTHTICFISYSYKTENNVWISDESYAAILHFTTKALIRNNCCIRFKIHRNTNCSKLYITAYQRRSNPPRTTRSCQVQWKQVLSSLFISWGCVPGNRDLNQKDVNRKLLDTVIYRTFVTKFSFSFQILHIYIYKETTYIELTQFITKSGHKKSRDVNRNDVYRKDL